MRRNEPENKRTLGPGVADRGDDPVRCGDLRMVPHPWNMTPIGAMALFSGAMIRKSLAGICVSDSGHGVAGETTGCGFHKLIPVVYASFLDQCRDRFWLRERRTVLCGWAEQCCSARCSFF